MTADRKESSIDYQQSVLEAIVEAIDAGILVVDDNRDFFTYNQNFVEMWEIPDKVVETGDDTEALQSVLDLLERPNEFLSKVEYFYENTNETSHDRIHLTDGRIFHRYTAPVKGEDGTYYGRVWYFRDITDRIEREQKLERQKEYLEEYADMVSHDLRNPLTVAQARLEMARQDCDSDHLEAISRSLDRMEELIDETLELTKDQHEGANVRPVELEKIAASCWENIDADEATLSIDTSQTIHADPALLQQLIENQLRNAVDHSEGPVSIRVDDIQNGFIIEDDGPGFPDYSEDRLFESGFSTQPEGTGIGLKMVSRIAEAHDWDVILGDAPSGGARVQITGVERP